MNIKDFDIFTLKDKRIFFYLNGQFHLMNATGTTGTIHIKCPFIEEEIVGRCNLKTSMGNVAERHAKGEIEPDIGSYTISGTNTISGTKVAPTKVVPGSIIRVTSSSGILGTSTTSNAYCVTASTSSTDAFRAQKEAALKASVEQQYVAWKSHLDDSSN